MNRGVHTLVLLVWSGVGVLGATACSSDDTAGGDDMSELRWDLRQPTPTRDLGADSDQKATVVAPDDELLDVEVLLPGVTVRGRWDMVTGLPLTVELSGPAQPVADLTLYDVDVTSVDDLRPILERFERDWGFAEADCVEVERFVREAEAELAEVDGDAMRVDWGLTPVVGFSGRPRGGVQPGLVVRLPAPTFSTFTRLTWDPAVEVDGDTEVVGSLDGSGTPADDSCIP